MQNRKEQISELTNLNEELENYFNNTIIPQLFVDAQLILRKFTPPAMKQFSLSANDIGKRIEEVKENFRFPTIVENINEVISSGEILEKEIQTVDRRWYQMNILPYVIRNENRTNGVIITFVDITPRVRDLRELERLVSENELLIDTLAHDIKTPLTAMELTIQMLKKNRGSERSGKFTELMGYLDNSVKKMRTMVQELMQSRWTEHPYSAVPELIDFQNILEDVKLTLAQQISEVGASIKYHLDVSEVFFVRRNLRSILYNLINNSIKYRSPHRPLMITIKTFEEGGFIVISVKDNGIGISRENQQRIFNKFQRVKSCVEGNGIGLYLVRELLHSSGGNISLSSTEGEGAEFKVYLKLHHNT
jgi:two-component system phosphate regulon sensor histidine kinase PhoR